MWRRFLLVVAVCLTVFCQVTRGMCPQMCICDIDEQGRKRTRCENGGVNIPNTFDLNSLDGDTEILIITGTPNRLNTFSLNANMFANKRFKEIHLSFSNLDYIGERTFTMVSNTLKVLNLTHNSLRAMSENNFRNLSLLTHLHLDYNRIASVHSAMFAYLTGLKVLTISNNFINDVPQRMGLQLTKLEVLDMSNNPIGVPVIEGVKQTIPDIFFFDFPNLKILQLSNTSLDSLPWASIQKNNIYLEELDMSNNKISEIQQNQLSLIRKLTRLKIANNPIRTIAPSSLNGMFLENLDLSGLPAANILQAGVFLNARVEKLDLSNTGLLNLNSDTFTPISRELIGLNVSGNPGLNIQPNMFMMLPSLKFLSMSQMRKSSLPSDLFNYDNQIVYLDLSNNNLRDLDDGFFSRLANLETLILNGNQLNRVPLTVSLARIREIDLSNNKLQSFPDNLVNGFAAPASALKSLKLNTNPWSCDCGVAYLGRWLGSQHGNPGYNVVCMGNGNFTCPVCYEPSQLRGTPLNTLPPGFLDTCASSDVKTSPTNANVDVIIAVVVCLIVLVIAILLLVLWYRNRLHSYRTYEEKRKDGDAFEHNGEVGGDLGGGGLGADVFEDVPPISKPKNGLPSSIIHVAPPVTALPKQESNV